ncbi:MAG: hypothetical protein H6686_05660 [Fibrobacteria bacterium]|nr:hypothetical protein [Fibrobacteria bacterium]
MKKSLFTVLAVTAVPLFADINSDLQQLGGSAAQGYLGPLVSTLGSDLNTGWFREAPKPELWGINISGRLVLTGTLFSDDAKVFSTTSQTQIDELTARLLAEKIVAQQGAAIPAAGKDAAVDAIISQLKGQSVTMEIAGPTVIGSDKETIKYRMKSPLSVTVGSGPAATTVAIDDQEVDLGVSGSDMAGVLPGVAVPFP